MINSSGKAARRKPHRSLGLEVTDRALKLCELLERRGRRPKVTYYRMQELAEGVIEDGRIKNDVAFRNAVSELINGKERKTNRIYLTVPSSLVMTRILKLPDIGHKELRRVVQYEMRNNLKVAFDNPYYDFVKLPKVASDEETAEEEALPDFPGEKVRAEEAPDAPVEQTSNVLVVAAPRAELVQYAETMEKLRLKPLGIEIAPLSALRLFERLSLAQLGLHLLVNIGRFASDITIFEDGVFRMTRQVEVEFPLPQREAASAATAPKDELSGWLDQFADPDQQFNQAARELIAEIERIMDFYYYTIVNQRGHVFKKIWVAGDIAELEEVVGQMRQQYSVDVSAIFWDAIVVDNRDRGWRVSDYAVPLGLALRGEER